jgi:hypothetical protein
MSKFDKGVQEKYIFRHLAKLGFSTRKVDKLTQARFEASKDAIVLVNLCNQVYYMCHSLEITDPARVLNADESYLYREGNVGILYCSLLPFTFFSFDLENSLTTNGAARREVQETDDYSKICVLPTISAACSVVHVLAIVPNETAEEIKADDYYITDKASASLEFLCAMGVTGAWNAIHFDIVQKDKTTMNQELFEHWMFVQLIPLLVANHSLSPQRPMLLFLDNCSAHSLSTCLKARYEGLHILFFPPNSTQIVQPCDVGLFSAWKATWRGKVLGVKAKLPRVR